MDEWNRLYGRGSTNADKLSMLVSGLPPISNSGSEHRTSDLGHAPSLGLFGGSGVHDDTDTHSFLLGRGSELEKFPVKEVTYIPDNDIEPVAIADEIEKLGDRCIKWKYMKVHLEYYLKSKYRLSAYIDVLGDMVEREMEIRIKGIPIVINSPQSERGYEIIESTKIHRWGSMQCVDTSTVLGKQVDISLRGLNPNKKHDPVISEIYENMLDTFLQCEKYNREDTKVVSCMKYILKRLEDSLIKASRACQCLSCYTQTRDDQDNEMREVALARYLVDYLGSTESKYDQVNPKDYKSKRDYLKAKRINIVSPEMDWIWDILRNFSSEDGKGAGGFAGISFQRNTAFVNDLTECCVYLWTAFTRLWFLIHLDEYVHSDICPRQLTSLYCLVTSPDTTTTNCEHLEELLNRSGSCPVLDFDTPVMLYDLHTTMLSIAELNSNILESPVTPDLVQYVHQLYGRYSSFSWFMFTEEDLMNAQAYVKSVQITNAIKSLKRKSEECGEQESVILYTHINKFFLRYGWNMLFPCIQVIRLIEGIESLLNHTFYIAHERTKGKKTAMTTEIFSHVREWGHQYMKKECARIACESYRAEVIQYMLRPGEMKMFKLKHDRGDTHPLNVINNLRPYDMDRINKSLLDSPPEDILDVRIFPLRLEEKEMAKRGKERLKEAEEEHSALSSLMKVQGLDAEWQELLKIMQSGVDTTGGNLDSYQRKDSTIQLDRIMPYGTKTCNDYLYYCLFISICYEKGSVIKYDQVIYMREVLEHELPKIFSKSLGVKIVNVSSPHNMKKFVKKSSKKKEKIFRIREYPPPIMCQLGGGYSVIWFSSSAIYHCETFIEALFYLSVCSLRYILDSCIYGKLEDVILGDISGGECWQIQKNLEETMKRCSLNSGMSKSDLRDESLETFLRRNVGIYMRTSHDLIECAEKSETGLPEKWEKELDIITFWYYIIVHLFGIYPSINIEESLFSASSSFSSEEEEEAEKEGEAQEFFYNNENTWNVRLENREDLINYEQNVHQVDI